MMVIVISAIGAGLLSLYVIRKWCDGGVCTSQAKLDGKTVIITGGNTGIGKETAIDLAKRGAKVIIACRNEEKAREALDDIKREAKSDLVFFKKLDLCSLKSIRLFVTSILSSEDRLDILINNAGVMFCPRMLTEDGFEVQFGVNHLGHFLLTMLLLDLLKRSAPSRILNVSSRGHFRGLMNFDDLHGTKSYSRFQAYAQSKLANVLFTRELNRHLNGSRVTTYAIHPGVVTTELGRHSIDKTSILSLLFMPAKLLFFKNPWQGAQTSIYCAVQEDIENQSGCYFSDCAETKPSKQALDDDSCKRLWEVSEKMVGLK